MINFYLDKQKNIKIPKTNQPSPLYQLNSKNILKSENESVKLKNQINNLFPSIEESSNI
jgi:hypothetical protein